MTNSVRGASLSRDGSLCESSLNPSFSEATARPWEAQEFDAADDGVCIIGLREGIPKGQTPTNGLVAIAVRNPHELESCDMTRCEANAALIGQINPPAFDDSDAPPLRSGMRIRTDNLTGCQYLTTFTGSITPRMDANGKQVCAALKARQEKQS